MSVSVVIPHFYSFRESNLRVIVDALLSGSVKPFEVLIWANDPLSCPISGASVITSHRNLGPQARFIAALAAVGDYVLFFDNDVSPQPKTIENLLAHSSPGMIATLEGRIYNGAPYRQTPKVFGRDVPDRTRVDLSLGRGEMVFRRDLQRILVDFPFGVAMDDMLFCASARRADVPIYVVPCVEGESALTNLPERGTGMSLSSEFYPTRDRIMRGIMGEK